MNKLLDATLVAMLLMASIPELPAEAPTAPISIEAEDDAHGE